MSRQTIHAVSSGEYSDYGIHALFATESLALAWIDVEAERLRVRAMRWNKERPASYYAASFRIEPFDYYEGDVLVSPGGVDG